MLTDSCTVCHQHTSDCTCEQEEATPCLPKPDSGECPDAISLACVFWMGDPIAGTPIKKGTRGTEILFYLLDEIKLLKQRVLDLEP